jgi:hypothetical protein
MQGLLPAKQCFIAIFHLIRVVRMTLRILARECVTLSQEKAIIEKVSLAARPRFDDYRRAIILFGRNVAATPANEKGHKNQECFDAKALVGP